jgi:HlyD family secretion protein
MIVADTSALHLKGVVDENDVGRLQVGQTARIRTEAFPDRVLAGRVRKVAPIGTRKNNVTSFTVEVAVLDGLDLLAPRMSADADIIAEVHDEALVVPEAALVYERDEVFVDVVEPGAPGDSRRRPARLGIAQKDRIEILDGVADGERVRLQ